MAQGKDEPTDYWLANLAPRPSPGALPASPDCAGRSSSTTVSSRASSASTTTKAAPGWLVSPHALVTAAHGFLILERLHL